MDELFGMIFVLLIIAMVGGFILVFPLSRRLAAYLEQRLQSGTKAADDAELKRIRTALVSLQAEIERLSERQEFTESLLAESPGKVRISPPEGGSRGS